MFFKKIQIGYIFIVDFFFHFCGFIKVILVGAIFTFSTFILYLALTYHTLGWIWTTTTGIISLATLLYFLFSYRKIRADYLRWHEGYIQWIDKTVDWQKFIISVAISTSLSSSQMILIGLMEYLVQASPGKVANTSLLVINIANFFLLRTYTFNNQEKNYFFQGLSYTFICALALVLNWYAVQYLATTHDQPWAGLVGITSSLPLIDKTGSAQLWWSTAIGWIWFYLYKFITFNSRVVL